MNRYTNNSISRFDPLSWEDISRVPLNKRTEHNARSLSLSTLDTNIGAIDNLDVHDEQTKLIQKEYRDKLDKLSSSLADEGVNSFNTQDILNLNSQYKKDWSPGGRAHNINEAKIVDAANKSRYMQAGMKDNWDANTLKEQYNNSKESYTGFNEDGKVISPSQNYMIKNFDTKKDIDTAFKGAAANIDTILDGKGWTTKKVGGKTVFYNSQGKEVTKTNMEQIQSVMDGLTSIYSDSNSNESKAAEMQGLNTRDLIKAASGKYGFTQTSKDQKFQMQQVHKAAKTNININNKPKEKNKDSFYTGGVNETLTPSKLLAKRFSLMSDIKTLTEKESLLGNAHKLKVAQADLRRYDNLQFDADNAFYDKTNSLYNQEDVDNVDKLKAKIEEVKKPALEMASLLRENIKKGTTDNNILYKVNTVIKELEEGKIDSNIEYTDLPDGYPAQIAKAFMQNRIAGKLNNDILDIKDRITGGIIRSRGKRETYFAHNYVKSADMSMSGKNMTSHFKRNLFDNNLEIYLPEEVFSTWEGQGNSRQKEVTSDIISTFKTLPDSSLKYGLKSTGNGPVLTITASLDKDSGKEYGLFNQTNMTLDKKKPVTLEYKLSSETDGVTNFTPFGEFVLKTMGYSEQTESELKKGLFNDVVVSNNDRSKIGDRIYSSDIVGVDFAKAINVGYNDENKGFDLFKSKHGITLYKIDSQNNPSNEPLSITEFIGNVGNEQEAWEVMAKTGVITALKKKAANTTMLNFLDELSQGNPQNQSDAISMLNDPTLDKNQSMAVFFKLRDKDGKNIVRTKYDTQTDIDNFKRSYSLFNIWMKAQDFTINKEDDLLNIKEYYNGKSK